MEYFYNLSFFRLELEFLVEWETLFDIRWCILFTKFLQLQQCFFFKTKNCKRWHCSFLYTTAQHACLSLLYLHPARYKKLTGSNTFAIVSQYEYSTYTICNMKNSLLILYFQFLNGFKNSIQYTLYWLYSDIFNTGIQKYYPSLIFLYSGPITRILEESTYMTAGNIL